MELALFDEAAEVVRGLVPRDLGVVRCRARRYGLKVWFATVHPPREHYEAQLVAGGALEVGFHAEHPDVARNDALLGALVASERRWRKTLGREAVAGPFVGREEVWRRISEMWPAPDLSDPELALGIGARVVDYVLALEPVRRAAARQA